MAPIEQEMSTPGMPVHCLAEDRIAASLCSFRPEDDPPVVCSKCLWMCALPSRCRTGLDRLLAFFLLRPFRCRSCHRRYYRLSSSQWAWTPQRSPYRAAPALERKIRP
jgi:hypothetical protein